MFGKLKTKRFWKIIALNFILWFVFNLLTEWAFTERDERSFSPLFIRDVIMNSLFMSIMFSVFFQPPGEPFTANADNGIKYYAGLFLFTFITVFLLALILLLLTFFLFSIFDTVTFNPGEFLLKPLVILLFLSILLTLLEFTLDRWRLRKKA